MYIDTFFCPSLHCEHHNKKGPDSTWFKLNGFHKTKAFGIVQRYKCKSCGKTFSDQTFLLNYYLKIKTDFHALSRQFNSSSSDCFIARHFKMSFDSLQNRRDRLARNALFFQTSVLEDHPIEESLCTDGLESFTKSKYYPIYLNALIGTKSRFLYFFTESTQKRKGVMTEKQKKRCEKEYVDKSFEGSALKKQFPSILEYIQEHVKNKSVTLYTDEHKTYEYYIKKHNEKSSGSEIIHHQTSSKEAWDQNNPLAPANYLDRLIRKDLPNHRRKTTCQARNDRNMLNRFCCYMLAHNFFKPSKILSRKNQPEGKHYDTLNLSTQLIQMLKTKIFTYRMCLSKIILPDYFKSIWLRNTPTPHNQEAEYTPAFAYG